MSNFFTNFDAEAQQQQNNQLQQQGGMQNVQQNQNQNQGAHMGQGGTQQSPQQNGGQFVGQNGGQANFNQGNGMAIQNGGVQGTGAPQGQAAVERPPEFSLGQGMQWSTVSDNARHPVLRWGVGQSQKGTMHDIQPGEELIAQVQKIYAFTGTKYKSSEKERTLAVNVVIGRIKNNQALADGKPRSIFFRDGKRRDLLMAGLAQGDIINMLYEGKTADNYHRLYIRVSKTPESGQAYEDPMGFEPSQAQMGGQGQAPVGNANATGGWMAQPMGGQNV